MRLSSSELAITEVHRAPRRRAAEPPGIALGPALLIAARLLREVDLIPVKRSTLFLAAREFDPHLGSLDAIHLATALRLSSVDAFVTYDKRQAAAARAAGLVVVSPGVRG
jgi:uncharacterized protein